MIFAQDLAEVFKYSVDPQVCSGLFETINIKSKSGKMLLNGLQWHFFNVIFFSKYNFESFSPVCEIGALT